MPRSRTTPNDSYRKGIFSKNPDKPPTIRYWCTICGDSAGRLAEFRRHMDCHSDNYRFMCDRSGCRQVGRGVGFHQKRNLTAHLDNAHNPQNRYACIHSWKKKDGTIEPCAARFKSKGALTTHRSRAHGFNAGDDLSKVNIPTPEGADFEYHNGHRGRRGDSAGAVIYFPDWFGDDHSAEAQFVEDVLSNTEHLQQSLAQLGVPYSTLPFHWPDGSSRGKQTAVKSRLGSTPTLVQYQSLAVPFAGSAVRNPLPYPLTTNQPAPATSPSATIQVGQQIHAYNPKPPALAPFFTQSLASGFTAPLPRPALTQGIGAEGSRTAVPQAVNSGFCLPHTTLVPPFPGTVDRSELLPASSATPTPLSRDVVNVGSSCLTPHSYGLPQGALLGGVSVNDRSLERASEPTVEPDYQFLQEPWGWFPCGGRDPM